MEKMKMSVGKMAALVLVAAAVSGLLINFGMVYAPPQEVKIEYELKIKEKNGDVEVEVKGKFNTAVIYSARAYTVDDCAPGAGNLIGVIGIDTDGGDVVIEGTLSSTSVNEVNSVSIRLDDGTSLGDLVQCFRNTTP